MKNDKPVPTYTIEVIHHDFVKLTTSYGHVVFHTREKASNLLTRAKTSIDQLVIQMLEDCLMTMDLDNEHQEQKQPHDPPT